MQIAELVRAGRWSRPTAPRFGTWTTQIVALALAVAFVAGACDAYAVGDGGGAGGGDLTLAITAPGDDVEVTLPFDVTFSSNVALGTPESGSHHIHLFVDAAITSSEYELVYGSTFQVTRELSPGEHTLIASLRNADHSDTGESQTITVVVAGADAGAGSPLPAATPPGLGY